MAGGQPDLEDRRNHGTVTTRILLFEMPELLIDLIRDAVAGDPELEVFTAHRGENADGAVRRCSPDLVMVELSAELPDTRHLALVEESPRLSVLGVRRQGVSGVVFQLQPHRRELGALEHGSLARAIHTMQVRGWDDPIRD